MKGVYKFFATGFDFGYLPGAPGTYGTVVGVGLYLIFSGLTPCSYAVFAVGFGFISVWITAMALLSFQEKDPQPIVIDEMAGFLVTMIGHPPTWLNIGMGFVLFRLFDITKPPPIRWLERKIPGAWGIVIDDITAGIFASISIWLIRRFCGQ